MTVGGRLNFSEGDSKAFARIVRHVYSANLELGPLKYNETTEDTANATSHLLTCTYATATLLGLEEIANKVIDAYARYSLEYFPAAADVLYLQNKGQEDSGLMKMMLQVYAFAIRDKKDHLDYLLDKEPHVFRKFYHADPKNKDTMVRVLGEIGTRTSPFKEDMDTCEYHMHDVTERCHSSHTSTKRWGGKRKTSEMSNDSGSTIIKRLRGGRAIVMDLEESE